MAEFLPASIDPVDWVVVFRPWSESHIVRALVPGRFKHVSACCYLPDAKLWLTFDVGFRATKIMHLPDGPRTDAILVHWLDGCTLVRVRRDQTARCWLPVLGWCAPSVARLVGLRGGALRPDSLYRQCLRNGGTIIGQGVTHTAACAAG